MKYFPRPPPPPPIYIRHTCNFSPKYKISFQIVHPQFIKILRSLYPVTPSLNGGLLSYKVNNERKLTEFFLGHSS